MPVDSPANTAALAADRTVPAKRIKPVAGADGRSAGARRLRTIEADLAAPFGGLSAISPIERATIESAALLSVRIGQLRAEVADGRPGATDEDLVRVSGALARAMDKLDRLAAARRKASEPSGSDALRRYLAERAEVAA